MLPRLHILPFGGPPLLRLAVSVVLSLGLVSGTGRGQAAEASTVEPALTKAWQGEKARLNESRDVKEKLEAARSELDAAQRKGDFARAGELTYSVIPAFEKKLEEADLKVFD